MRPFLSRRKFVKGAILTTFASLLPMQRDPKSERATIVTLSEEYVSINGWVVRIDELNHPTA